MRAAKPLRVIVCAFGAAAVAAACLRAPPPESVPIDAGDAGVPDAVESGGFDAAPALRYEHGCQYCWVPCYPARKTCAELGIQFHDPCFVVGETNIRTFADAPTESCVYEFVDREEKEAGDGGGGICTVLERFLTCLPARSATASGLSCGGGGVPCPARP
jgi:hypothetical protein